MTVDRIDERRIALFISDDELNSFIPADGQFNLQTAQQLAQTAFSHWGEELHGSLELEAFAGTGGVLLFARLIDNEIFAYTYESFEHILEAAHLLANSTPKAELYLYEQYYIILTETELSEQFSEYSVINIFRSVGASIIREHGRLLSSDIFSEISGSFKQEA